jgi:hypothetical protein
VCSSAEEVRRSIAEADPELLALAEALRQMFSARLSRYGSMATVDLTSDGMPGSEGERSACRLIGETGSQRKAQPKKPKRFAREYELRSMGPIGRLMHSS